MKLYYNSATETAPEVIDGDPPADQSAELAAANTKIAAMQTVLDGVKARAEARKAADAAKVDGQDDLDAIAALP